MKLTWDYHTHTVYSHGKGTIEDNVKQAILVGLEEIAISDHGPGHVGFGIKRKNIKVMREEISLLEKKYPQIRILLGVEANIMNSSGHLDVSKEEMKAFDVVLAGYHYGVFGESPIKSGYLHLGNLAYSKFGTRVKAIKKMNTEMAVKALYENPIKILTHPGDKYEVDFEEIVKACRDNHTLLEISNSHAHLTAEEIKIAAKYCVEFAIGSDAHAPSRVGCFENALKRAREAGLDLERIVNLTKCEKI